MTELSHPPDFGSRDKTRENTDIFRFQLCLTVQLGEDPNEISLAINDSGKGFDVEAAAVGGGLGLISMQERVRLVNGTIAIESKLMGETTIHVRVPLRSFS